MHNLIVSEIELHNFRCFTHKKMSFLEPITWIIGPNGTGKTSLFEALHYACYLRSFRALHTREMIQVGNDSFFIKATIHTGTDLLLSHQLQVGFSGKKRIVKIDQKPVSSHKELMDYLRVVTITEDDLALVQDGPQQRRSFLDQTIAIQNQEYAKTLKELKNAVEHKHALLGHYRIEKELYTVWTEQIRQKSEYIQKERIALLEKMQVRIAELFVICGEPHLTVDFEYLLRSKEDSMDQLFQKEIRYKRVLQGAHLDDIKIAFQGKSSRIYASRGQQKLTLFLMKICQIEIIQQSRGPVLVLVDDFITDFDYDRQQKITQLFALIKGQIIYTVPQQQTIPSIIHSAAAIELSY